MSRFLHRPMFRRGGSTGEGITSGLRRGYAHGIGPVPSVNEPSTGSNDLNLNMEMLKRIGATDIELPKSTSGADFWLNLGTSILAQPGGKPILQTLGTAGQEPLARYQQQRAQESALKYKHGMSNRQFLLDAWKAMSDDDKTAMQKNIAWLQTPEGGGLTQEEALDRVAGEFRKRAHPEEKKYKEEQREEDFYRDQIGKIQDDFRGMDQDISLTYNQAEKIYDFKTLADEKGYPFRTDESIFIDRASWPKGSFTDAIDKESGNITLHRDNVANFEEGFAYIDLTTGQGYYRDGIKLIKIVVDEDIISNN